jgi:hypothetical protein
MSHKFLLNSSFHSLLNAIDQELLNKAQEAGCPFCDGRLDRADYPRSPLGIPAQFRESYDERFSLCCVECRKRTTPPSVRFFGRRWYPAPVLVLISLLTLGINDYRLGQLKRHFGVTVSESTWKRWRRWWRESFAITPFWQQAKGLCPPDIEEQEPFPRNIFSIFTEPIEEKMRLLLKFLSPLTIGVLRAV